VKVIPAIDIIDGKCVRLTKGDFSTKKEYAEDPVAVAKDFEQAGIKYLHVVDLDGAQSGNAVNLQVVSHITSQTNLRVDFGGGIKTADQIEQLFDMGVSQVNLGTIAWLRPYSVIEWILHYGADRIILSADVKEHNVLVKGWQEEADLNIFTMVESFVQQGLQHLTCTDVQRDGMLQGPSVALYTDLKTKFPKLNIVASGGVKDINDLIVLKGNGLAGAIVGKAFYEGYITLEEMVSITD